MAPGLLFDRHKRLRLSCRALESNPPTPLLVGMDPGGRGRFGKTGSVINERVPHMEIQISQVGTRPPQMRRCRWGESPEESARRSIFKRHRGYLSHSPTSEFLSHSYMRFRYVLFVAVVLGELLTRSLLSQSPG